MAESKSVTRGEFADMMVACMRGEVNFREIFTQTPGGNQLQDADCQAIIEEMRYHYGGLKDTGVTPACGAWGQLCRWVAFLRTDFHLVKRWPKLVRIPWVFPLLFLLILAASLRMSQQFIFMTWFWLGVAWSVMIYLRDQKNLCIRNHDEDFQRACGLAPFLSQDDWQAHKHLLDRYSLPVADVPVDDGKCRNAYRPQTDAMYVFVVMIFLPVVLLCSIFSRQRLEHFRIFVRREPQEVAACEK